MLCPLQHGGVIGTDEFDFVNTNEIELGQTPEKSAKNLSIGFLLLFACGGTRHVLAGSETS